jgi:hypothetical protein
MDSGALFRRTATIFNRAMVPAMRTGVGRRVLGSWMAEVRYTGRRSGKEVTLPVGYKRDGDDLVILVAVPGAKTWWRNFLGAGAPMHLTMGRIQVEGYAVATQDDRGRVTVRVTPT